MIIRARSGADRGVEPEIALACARSVAVRPHPKHAHHTLVSEQLVNQPVVDVDPA
jgi:hypothetical protein